MMKKFQADAMCATLGRPYLSGRGRLALLALGVLSVACGDPLKDGQKLEETRSLGVRVTNADQQATPGAGEAAEVQFLFAGPSGPAPVALAYQVCPSIESARGVPQCAGDPWAQGDLSVVDDADVVAFTVPTGTDEATRFAILAVGCESGDPQLLEDPLDWSCSDGSAPLKLAFDAWTGGESVNDNPNLGVATISFDGEEALLESVGLDAECAPDVATVGREEKVEMRLELPDGARDAVDETSTETLQISHFSSAGLLQRQFTILDGEESLEVTIEWESPRDAGPVKHYVVVRDGRGGVSWLSTSVCVVE